MIYGLLDLTWWQCLIVLLMATQITIASITLFLHRSQAHRSVDFHPVINHFFRFWLWMTTGMNTKEWVAIHRKHHVKCETPDDPHSPQVKGISTVLLQGSELYRAEAKNQETLSRYGKGTPDDWMEKKVYSRHPVLGIALMFAIDILLFGVYGITFWAIQMLWSPIFAAGIINGVGHYWGYRNFECADASKNISCWGIFIGGEELHNNHHTYPNSAKLSVKWFEFDIGWFYITVMKWLGLAKVRKALPKLKRVNDKNQIDIDTLRALFSNPLQIMSRYSKDVVVPIYKQESKRASVTSKKLYRHAKRLLILDNHLMDNLGKQKLSKILDNNQAIAQVYQFKQRLNDIWNRTSASQKELLDALQEWCKQAEATGIDVLQRFSSRLKTYVPKAG